jgi:hypothetical protein
VSSWPSGSDRGDEVAATTPSPSEAPCAYCGLTTHSTRAHADGGNLSRWTPNDARAFLGDWRNNHHAGAARAHLAAALDEIEKLRDALLDVLIFADDGDTASRRAAIQHGREALGDPRTVGEAS